jgi:hypothetical protein
VQEEREGSFKCYLSIILNRFFTAVLVLPKTV